MARRRRNEGLIEVLLGSPWWVSVTFGGVAFIVFRWLIPSILAKHLYLTALAPMSRSAAWFLLAGCTLIAAIVFVRTRDSVRSPNRLADVSAANLPKASVSVNAPVSALDEAWGRSGGKGEAWGRSAHSSNGQTHSTAGTSPFDTWTIEALRALEWKRFELLCAQYYDMVGFRSETIRSGADGGVDVRLFKSSSVHPIVIAQCKAWNVQPVGVKEIRELLGVMAHEKVGRGIFLTTSTYTKDALAFGAANPIQLLDGEGFLAKICLLSLAQQSALLKFAFEGDYSTPTCPSCGIKLTRRDSKRGPFWGCLNFPRCRATIAMRS